MTAVSEVAQTDTTGIQEWVKESLKRTKKKKSLSPPTLSLIEEKNRKKDASCFDSCSQFNVSSKVNILS